MIYTRNGNGSGKIANILNEKKIDSPARYKQSLGNHIPTKFNTGLWYDTTILKMLKNEMYIGNMVQGYSSKISYKINKYITIPKDKWIIIKDKHEGIITKKQFYHVQEILEERRRASNDTGEIHIFSGKLRCESCNLAMYKKTYKSGVLFRCKTHELDKTKCTSHSISYKNLEETVTQQVRKHLQEFVDIKESIKDIPKQKNTKCENIEKELKKLESNQHLIEIALKNLYIDKTKEIISQEEYITLKEDFINDKEHYIKIKEKLIAQKNCLVSEENLEKMKNELVERFLNFDELSYIIVQSMIDYIEVCEKDSNKNQDVKTHWLF